MKANTITADIIISVESIQFPHKFATRLLSDIRDVDLFKLDPSDLELLIRDAAGKAARAAENVFEKVIKDKIVNSMLEQQDGTLRLIYKDLNH